MKTIDWGELSLSFDDKSGYLRNLTFGKELILSALYPAVRDADWGTLAPGMEFQESEESMDGLLLTWGGTCAGDKGDLLKWRCVLSLEEEGDGVRANLKYRGEALAPFLSNRIGLCYHLPLLYKGRPCSKSNHRGDRESVTFPVAISPDQPMEDVSTLSFHHPSGITVKMDFSETYEMEDQRNWTDASYKLYAPPLNRPFPRQYSMGDVIEQELILTLSPPWKKTKGPAINRTSPGLAVEASFPCQPLKVSSPFMIIGQNDLIPRLRDWGDREKGLNTDLILVLTDVNQDTVRALRDLAGKVNSLRVLPVDEETMTTGKQAKDLESRMSRKGIPPNLTLCRGTRGNFAELNRQLPVAERHHPVIFAAALGVHSADEMSWLENLEGFQEVLRGAKDLYRNRKIVVSPAGIGQVWNPVAAPGSAEKPLESLKSALAPYLMAMMVRAVLIEEISQIDFHDLITPESGELFQALAAYEWRQNTREECPLESSLILKNGENGLKVRLNHANRSVQWKKEGPWKKK